MQIFENLQAHLDKLRATDAIILVEGKKDVAALAALGVTRVMAVTGKPLYQVVEAIAARYRVCIILTDLDTEGKKLFAYFTHTLSERGVRIDNQFRLFLFRYTPLRHIEGLVAYLRRLQ